MQGTYGVQEQYSNCSSKAGSEEVQYKLREKGSLNPLKQPSYSVLVFRGHQSQQI